MRNKNELSRILRAIVLSAVLFGIITTAGCLSAVPGNDATPTTTRETTTTYSAPTETTVTDETQVGDETTTESETSRGIDISYVSADAPFNDSENLNGERIELTNTGERSINMTGWTVEDEDNNTFYFPDGFTLAAGESVMIHSGSGQNTSDELYWNASYPIWDNDGDTVYVYNSSGEVCSMDCIRIIYEVQ